MGTLFKVSILIFLLIVFFTAMESSFFFSGKRGSFPLVPSDVQQLFSHSVLRRVAVLEVGFKQRQVRNSPLQ